MVTRVESLRVGTPNRPWRALIATGTVMLVQSFASVKVKMAEKEIAKRYKTQYDIARDDWKID